VSSDSESLARFLAAYESVAVLGGAGVSTASGIPDYRDRHGNWKHDEPIQYGDFVRSARVRGRYWARSYAGWPHFSEAWPNSAHRALAALEMRGKIQALITQNVDGLHGRAGSRRVLELHGNLATVRCVGCDADSPRTVWQRRLDAANPHWKASVSRRKPDGNAELHNGHDRFAVPECESCGGVVKPDVVMFGESVPRDRVRRAFTAVGRADALLVVGSSLTVYSGFRFVRCAHEKRKPIAILNLGRTRADDMASLLIDADCSEVLPDVLECLG
jgi:NAD-dependent SIR2 family protein deacetylase